MKSARVNNVRIIVCILSLYKHHKYIFVNARDNRTG